MAEITFPDGFLWGTATAAHQVEGGNWNNDWWAWEHNPMSGCAEPSGDAIDHYHRYPEDIALLASLGFKTYRFSIEWSRIEPEEGESSRAALAHYRRIVDGCRDRGLTPDWKPPAPPKPTVGARAKKAAEKPGARTSQVFPSLKRSS